MIWDSVPWKGALLADASLLERWASKPTATNRRSVLIERKLFLAAYSIRKLWEAQKTSTGSSDQSFRCITFPPISDRITRYNNYKLDEIYNFEKSKNKEIDARSLINLVIHSFVFAESLRDDMTVEGFFVTSDRERDDRLWLVPMEAFINFMRQVGGDYPSTAVRVFDRDKNDWIVWQGHGDPPTEFVRRTNKILKKVKAEDRDADAC